MIDSPGSIPRTIETTAFRLYFLTLTVCSRANKQARHIVSVSVIVVIVVSNVEQNRIEQNVADSTATRNVKQSKAP